MTYGGFNGDHRCREEGQQQAQVSGGLSSAPVIPITLVYFTLLQSSSCAWVIELGLLCAMGLGWGTVTLAQAGG